MIPTYNVSLLGTEGTGKSCFLAGLNYVGSNPMNPAFTVFPLMDDPVAKRYLSEATAALTAGRFPTGTTETTFLEFDVQIGKYTMRIKTMDYPGEDFRDGITRDTPKDKVEEFAKHLLTSGIVIWLADPNALLNAAEGTEERTRIINSVNANLQAAREVVKEQKVKVKEAKYTDICIAVGKFDKLPEYKQVKEAKNCGQKIAQQFFDKNFPNAAKQLADATGRKIKKITYFPISAVGNTVESENSTARDKDGLAPDKDHLEPFGYDTMFKWIKERKERLEYRRFRRQVCSISIVCVALAILLILVYGFKTGVVDTVAEQNQLAILENKNLSVIERLTQTRLPSTTKVAEERLRLLDNGLERYKQLIDNTSDEQQLLTYRDELDAFTSSVVGDRYTDVQNLIGDISKKIVANNFTRVEDANERKLNDFEDIANKFVRDYPATSEADTVRQWLNERRDQAVATARQRIKAMPVNNAGNLDGKRTEIVKILESYGSTLPSGDVDAMRRAVDLAKRFAEERDYTVTVRQFGGFRYKEDQKLRVSVGNSQVYEFKSHGQTEEVNPHTQFKMKWQCGVSLKIELLGYYGWGSGWITVATVESHRPDALKLFSGRRGLEQKSSSWDGSFFVTCSIAEVSESDWKIFENYILPGNAW